MKWPKQPANQAEADAALSRLVDLQGYFCPSCKGQKGGMAHINRGDDPHTFEWIDCRICGGAGRVTREHMARIQEGVKLRADRIARDLSLYEEARRLGISTVELSDMETGRLRRSAGSET